MNEKMAIINDYLHVDYLKQLNEVQELNINQFIYQFNRVFIKFLGLTACVDITTGRDPTTLRPIRLISEPQSISWWQRLSICKKRRLAPRPKLHWFSYVILALFCLISLHVMRNLTLQYEYDFDQLRLRRLINGTTTTSTISMGTIISDKIVRLEVKLAETKRKLDSIGSAYSHLSIALECFQLYILSYSILVYFLSLLYFQHVQDFDLHVVREQLDYQAESKNTYQLIETKVQEFWISCQSYEQIWGDLSSQNQLYPIGRSKRALQQQQQYCNANYFESTGADKIVLELYKCGSLRLMNKSLKWFAKRSLIVFIYQLFILLYMCLFSFYLASLAITRSNPKHFYTWQDVLLCISMAGLILTPIFAACLFTTYFLSACLDQIVAVNKIRQLIKQCININKRLFMSQQSKTIIKINYDENDYHDDDEQQYYRLRDPKTNIINDSDEINVEKMNTNLLFVLMHYKIFTAQHKAAKCSCQSAIVFVSGVLLLIPIIAKIHIPYFMLFGASGNIRVAATILSLTIVGPANACIFPLCYMHSRCVGLYRMAASLMAHVAEMESQQPGVYDEHSIMVLVKELRHPERFVDQFKPKLIGLCGTFTTMVKIHFWWGLIVISTLFDTQSDNGHVSIESLFADPLGVF